MQVLAIEAPGSASPRQRAVARTLMGLTLLGLPVVYWLQDTTLPQSPGLVVFSIGAITLVQGIAAVLFFDLSSVTEERSYLYIGAGCEFVALMGVVWALSSGDTLAQAPPVEGTAAVGVLARLSMAVVYALCLGLAAVAYRSDHAPHRDATSPAVRVRGYQSAVRTAVGVAAVAGLWVGGLLAFSDRLPPLTLGGAMATGTYPASWWIVVGLVVLSVLMVLPSYLTHSQLHTWLMTTLVLLAAAILCGMFTRARYTVSWYGTYFFLTVGAGVLLTLILTELRIADRRRHTELQQMTLRAESTAAHNLALASKAATDPLTGLSNRSHFFAELAQRVAATRHPGAGGRRLAVAVVDFDGFKAINDRWGHATGDLVLQELANRMRRYTRGSDLLSRIGGDEFALAYPVVGGTDVIAARMDSLVTNMRRPIAHEGAQLQVGCSLGFCVAPDDGTEPQELYRNADRAMYQAKHHGRGRAMAYTSAMAVDAARESELRADALRGINERRLGLAYQPILDLRRGGVWGFEALLRMTQDDGTVVPAGDFLDALIAGGQVHALGTAVLDQLAHDLPLITALSAARVSFNLSAAELADRALVGRVITGDLAPYTGRLVVEITEETMAAPWVKDVLSDLRDAGITVAVDDFGTGRSNMALLEQAQPGVIKVDREFTAGLADHGSGVAVMRSAVSLAEGLRSIVVAEGVETPQQEAALPGLGVHFGQGYALGRPLTLFRAAL